MRILGATILIQSRADAETARRTTSTNQLDGFTVGYEDGDVTTYRLKGDAPPARTTGALLPLTEKSRASLNAVMAPNVDLDTTVVRELDSPAQWPTMARPEERRCDRSNA